MAKEVLSFGDRIAVFVSKVLGSGRRSPPRMMILPVQNPKHTETSRSNPGINTAYTLYPTLAVYGGGSLTSIELRKVFRLSGSVRKCVTSISHVVSRTPIKVLGDSVDKESVDDLFNSLNNEGDTFRDVINAYVVDLLTIGRGVIVAKRDLSGKVIGLYSRDSSTVFPKRERDGTIVKYIQNVATGVGKDYEEFKVEDVIFQPFCTITYANSDPPIIESIANEIAASMRLADRTAHYSDKGTIPPGILSMEKISPEGYTRAKEEFTNPEKVGLKVVDNVEGLEFIALASGYASPELFDSLDHIIFRSFGLVAPKQGVSTVSSDAMNFLAARSDFFTPIVLTLQDRLNILLRDTLGGEIKFFKRFMYSPSDLKELVTGIIITPNEAREQLDLLPKPGGDDLILSTAQGAINILGEPVGGMTDDEEEGPVADVEEDEDVDESKKNIEDLDSALRRDIFGEFDSTNNIPVRVIE